MRNLIVLVCTLLLFSSAARAEMLCVAGDSMTVNYQDEFFNSAPPEWEVCAVAWGGLRGEQFNGDHKRPDRTQEMIDLDPDYVTVLLGVNNAYDIFDWEEKFGRSPEEQMDLFATGMTEIFDRWEAAGIVTHIGMPPPVLPINERMATTEERLALWYRPWLWAEAEARGLYVVDFEGMFLSQPDWGDGSLFISDDGVHATAVGEQMMADLVIAVPEPGSTLMLVMGVGITLLLSQRRNR